MASGIHVLIAGRPAIERPPTDTAFGIHGVLSEEVVY